MDHYQILGVRDTASKDEITKAYHRKALKYHPDKSSASDAEEKFRAVNKAYQTLKDEHKRYEYDSTRVKRPSSSSRSHHSHHQSHHRYERQRHDEQFFRGASAAYSDSRKEQDTLDRIRRLNSDRLDATNLARKRAASRRSSSNSSRKTAQSRTSCFVGDIMPHLSDEQYEDLVLEKLRRIAR